MLQYQGRPVGVPQQYVIFVPLSVINVGYLWAMISKSI